MFYCDFIEVISQEVKGKEEKRGVFGYKGILKSKGGKEK